MSPSHRQIPDDLRGVWQRTQLQTGTDAICPPVPDTDSWVRWLQTSLWHGDLRIPSSALHARCAMPLKQMSPQQHNALAKQQGFAGITQVEALPEGQICTRLRRVDYQPPGLTPDAGWLMFDRPDHFIEIGVHADHNAIWARLPDSTGRYIALAGRNAQGDDDGRRLLVAGRYMMMIRPRHARWPASLLPGDTLADVMQRHSEQVTDWLDCDISFGHLQQGHWHIEHATLPEREGQRHACQLHRHEAHVATVKMPDADGDWHVLEWGCNANDITD